MDTTTRVLIHLAWIFAGAIDRDATSADDAAYEIDRALATA